MSAVEIKSDTLGSVTGFAGYLRTLNGVGALNGLSVDIKSELGPDYINANRTETNEDNVTSDEVNDFIESGEFNFAREFICEHMRQGRDDNRGRFQCVHYIKVKSSDSEHRFAIYVYSNGGVKIDDMRSLPFSRVARVMSHITKSTCGRTYFNDMEKNRDFYTYVKLVDWQNAVRLAVNEMVAQITEYNNER